MWAPVLGAREKENGLRIKAENAKKTAYIREQIVQLVQILVVLQVRSVPSREGKTKQKKRDDILSIGSSSRAVKERKDEAESTIPVIGNALNILRRLCVVEHCDDSSNLERERKKPLPEMKTATSAVCAYSWIDTSWANLLLVVAAINQFIPSETSCPVPLFSFVSEQR
jgi:hypothetical protein